MIPLRLPLDPLPLCEPTIVRLRASEDNVGPFDAVFLGQDGPVAEYDLSGFSLRLRARREDIRDDVLLLLPGQKSAHRLIRAKSTHNTFLVTELCDQLCVMCSQPPKKHHADLFPLFAQAALLAPRDVYLGVSGGEPTLFKEELFGFLGSVLEARPDLRFHVLTNGQHFGWGDLVSLRAMPADRVLWGIPLYADEPTRHDEIVAKEGAFDRLTTSFAVLAHAGAAIELRTVVMQPNAAGLPALARHVSRHLPFIASWAIMQLESIGYGRKNWDALFYDNSIDFAPVAAAIDIARAHGIDVGLFNFPRCTVPEAYRALALSTISDWKRKYLGCCDGCEMKPQCGGFFEWYAENKGFAQVGAP
ncbi:His-Xaa-Ser system radical SAM maturase HxsC [Consotaella aegiceratis]|uniref:His-Xaa-Ser system radical SAM maturase HxsC n=1 Tax=Consotaella aegiceratis TaxID=3097961 RepID=UPI002F3EB820